MDPLQDKSSHDLLGSSTADSYNPPDILMDLEGSSV
jgi:hypothetical protein